LASPTNLSERGPAIYTGTATIMITDTDEDHTEMKTLREHFHIYLPAPVQQTEWQVNYDNEASLPELLYEWSCFGGDGPVAILVNPARYEEKLRKQVRVYFDTDPPTALTRFSKYKRTEAGKAHTLKHWKVVLPAEAQPGLSALSGAKLFAYSHGGNKGSRSELTTCELTGRVPFAVEGEDINQGSMATEFDDIPLAILDTLGAQKLETPRAFWGFGRCIQPRPVGALQHSGWPSRATRVLSRAPRPARRAGGLPGPHTRTRCSPNLP
jgi:hypothetical protein